ncbi:hypothetical protein YC2023_044141 [Brassica napus]
MEMLRRSKDFKDRYREFSGDEEEGVRVSFLRVSDLRAKEGCEWVTIGNREHHRSRVTSYRIEMEEAASVGDAHARGKHRILAELGRVDHEVRFLEKELEELGQTDIVLTVCEE